MAASGRPRPCSSTRPATPSHGRSDIFAKAGAEGRVVLTFDLDFGEIVAATRERATSVIVFRLHDTRTDHVIDRLRDVLVQSSDVLTAGAIIVVEDAQHRVRRLPIERSGP